MTLKDIADKAGVSMMTVSNVINGKHNRVSAKTIEKINQIIKECNYVPNMSARSLSNKNSNIILIVIVARNESDYKQNVLENPYVSTMLGTIELELRANGYYTMLRFGETLEELEGLLRNWNIDGIIFLYPILKEKIHEFIKSSKCPVLIFDSYLESDEIVRVLSDDEKGLYMSTKYVINRGHRHIAFVGEYKGNPMMEKRFEGYKQALYECGIPFRQEYVFPYPQTYEGGIEAGRRIAALGGNLSAVVTTADICAVGVMEGARLSGMRVPIDLSVVGYDDLQLCQFTFPKLTSVSQNTKEKALTSVKLLLEKIRNGQIAGSSKVVLDVELVERQSVISQF